MRRAWGYFVGSSANNNNNTTTTTTTTHTANNNNNNNNNNSEIEPVEQEQETSCYDEELEKDLKNHTHTADENDNNVADSEEKVTLLEQKHGSNDDENEDIEDNVSEEVAYAVSAVHDDQAIREPENGVNEEKEELSTLNEDESSLAASIQNHEKMNVHEEELNHSKSEKEEQEQQEQQEEQEEESIGKHEKEDNKVVVGTMRRAWGYFIGSSANNNENNNSKKDEVEEETSCEEKREQDLKNSDENDFVSDSNEKDKLIEPIPNANEDSENNVNEDVAYAASAIDDDDDDNDHDHDLQSVPTLKETRELTSLNADESSLAKDEKEEDKESIVENEKEDHELVVAAISDSDEDEWDEDDPFGFDADREQENLLEAFRINLDDDDDDDDDKDKSKLKKNGYLNRAVEPSLNNRMSHGVYTNEGEGDDISVESDEAHPNQALFDILDRNFDDLDSFHVPSLNRLITADDIKLFFVAFVVVLTPPKPFEFARKYNHDVSTEEIMKTSKGEEELASKRKRRRWLFRRKRTEEMEFEDTRQSTHDEYQVEDNKMQSNKDDDDEHTAVHVPYEVVLALWMEVAKGLGVIKNVDTETESMKLIMNHVQESLMDIGLLEIETQKKMSNSLHSIPIQETIVPYDSSSVSIDSNKSDNTTKDTRVYTIRHAINEQYGLYLAKSENSDVNDKVSKCKKGWFKAVAAVHNDISKDVDEFQMLMLPYLCIKGNQFSVATNVLLNEDFIGKRFETMGMLLCATTHLTDIDTLVKSRESPGELSTSIDDVISDICSLLQAKFEASIDDSRHGDDFNGSSSSNKKELDMIIESGKSFHLMALLFGSLGYVAKELEYHAESIKWKEYWVELTTDNAIASLSLSDSYNCMGIAYDNIGDFEEAITCYDRALTTRRSLLGNNHLKVAETCHSMGSLLCEQHELDSAYLLLEEALRIRMYHLSERDGLVADTEQWLGNLMREQGRLDEALDYFKSALVSKKAKVGNDHEDVADAMHNMAIILDDMEKHELSISCYQEALRIRQLIYGSENLMVADTLLCLGNAYKAVKKNHKAVYHIKNSIDIREKLLAPYDDLNDSSLIMCMADLSDDLLGQHKGLIDCYTELHPLLEDINRNKANNSTEEKMSSNGCLQQMGNIYTSMRCWDDAFERYQSALTSSEEFDPALVLKIGFTCIRRNEFEVGKEKLYDATQKIKTHPENSSILHHSLVYTLGVTYFHIEQYELAISSFNECLNILGKFPRPIFEGNTHHWIGRCYYETQDYTSATKSILSSLKIYNEHRADVNDQIIYRTLHLLGNTHFRNKQIKLALKCYQEEISLFENSVTDMSLNDDCLSEAHYCSGIIHAKRGLFEEASVHLETALETRKRFQGEENKKVAKILHKLGKIYIEKKEYERAKEKLSKAYHLLFKIQGPNDEYTATVQFKLGQALDFSNELDDAMEHYRQCLEARKNLNLVRDEEVGIVLFHMGKNASSRLRYDESIEYLEEALDIGRKVYSMDDDLIAVVLFELGNSYKCQKRMDKSLLCYREALRIWKLSSDKFHASQASFAIAQIFEGDNKIHLAIKNYSECITLNPNSDHSRMHLLHCRLGNLYEQSDDFNMAVFHFEKSKEFINKNEIDDKNLVDTLHSLSQVYSKMKRYDDALQCNKDLVSLQSDSSSLADVFHSMGNTYFALGQNEEALEYLNKSLSVQRANRDPDILIIAKTLVDLAKVNESIEDLNGAYDNLVEALRIFKLKHEIKFTFEALDTLAKINQSMQKLDEAKECYEESISLKTGYLGDTHLSLAHSLHEFGCLCMIIDDFSGSLELLKSALKIRKQELGLHHEDTTVTIIKIGESYFCQEQYDASLRCFEQVLPVLKKLDNDNSSVDDLFVCNSFIGAIHYKEGRFESAVGFLKQAIQSKGRDNTRVISLYDTLYFLGSALQFTKNHSEAIKILRKAAQQRKSEIGANSKQYAESLAALGESYYYTNKYEEAMTQTSKALDVLKSLKCTEDVLYAQIQVCVAKILTAGEKYDDAIRLLDSSIELYEDAPSNYEKEIATAHLHKGKIYAKQSVQLNKAIEQFKKCLELRKKISGDTETEAVAEVLMEVGIVLADKNEHASSLSCFLEALKLRKKIHDEGRLIALAAYRVGVALLNVRKFNEALVSFEEARNNFPEIDEHYPLDIGKLEFSIGLVHQECNRPDEALKCFKIAIDTLQEQDDEDCFAQCHYHAALLMSEKEDDTKSMNSLFEALELLRGNNEKNKVQIAHVLIRLGDIHEQKVEEGEAMPFYLEAAQIYDSAKRHIAHALSLLKIGELYMKSDRLDKAYPFFKKAWSIHEQYPVDEKKQSSILYGLGFIYNQRAQHEEAMGVLKRSLKLRLVLLGKTSLDVATTCEQLGTALVSLTRYEDALKVCTTALDIYRNKLGENHICCARVMLDIGTIYCHKENYDLSLVQLQACLQFFKNECGDISEEVANVLLRIGQIHDLRVDHDEAMKCMTDALEIRTEMYGSNDVRVAETMLNIARVLQDWGDVDEAMDCFQNALKIYKLCKEDHLSAEVYNEIGNMYSERNEHTKALDAYNKALTIFKDKVGNDSTEVGNTLRNIGAVYDALNDISTSYKYYSDSLKILSHNLGKDDLGVSLVLNNLGINLARRKEYNKAFEFCKEALLIRRKLLPDGHLDIADTLFNIANILDDKGDKDDQALKFYTEALANYKMNFGDDNEDVANCNKNIGLIYMRKGESANALKKISEALRIFRLKHGDNNAEVASLLYSLGRLFGKQAKYDKALACFSECLKIRHHLLGEDHEETAATKRFVVAIQRKMSGGR